MISVHEFVKSVTNRKASFANPVNIRKNSLSNMLFFNLKGFKDNLIFYRGPRTTTTLVIEVKSTWIWASTVSMKVVILEKVKPPFWIFG